MPSAEQRIVRLSVWRPVSRSRWFPDLLDAKEGQKVDPSEFHESIFRWDMPEDPRDAISDSNLSLKIKEELFDSFRLERAPADRSIAALESKASILDQALAAKAGSWMPSGLKSPWPRLANEEIPISLRQNRLLAFRQMLQWVCDTFRNVPDASVTLV